MSRNVSKVSRVSFETVSPSTPNLFFDALRSLLNDFINQMSGEASGNRTRCPGTHLVLGPEAGGQYGGGWGTSGRQ